MGKEIIESEFVDKKFNRLTVLSFSHIDKHRNKIYKCQCDCGNIDYYVAYRLRNNHTKSCGCWREDLKKTHGMYKTTEYKIWENMKARTTNPNSDNYYLYGAIGRTLCQSWYKFENFFNDMGNRPSKKHSLDRIDNNKGYSKENCRWVTADVQQNNMKSNVRLTLYGDTLNIGQWAKKLNLKLRTLRARLESGWSVEKALTTPTNRKYANKKYLTQDEQRH